MRKKALAVLASSMFVFSMVTGICGAGKLFVYAAEESVVGQDEVTTGQQETKVSQKEEKDTVNPVLRGIKNKVVYAKSKVNYRKGVTAYDDTDGNLTKKIKVNSSKVNLKKPGKYVVTYSVKDSAGNTTMKKVTIKVKRDKAPVITGVKNRTIYVNGSVSYKKGVKAKDDKDGVITNKIKINSLKVNLKKPGKYVVTYSVKDSYGHKTIKKAVIKVKKRQSTKKEYSSSAELNGKVINWNIHPKEGGKEVNGNVPAGGKNNVGTW